MRMLRMVSDKEVKDQRIREKKEKISKKAKIKNGV